MEIDQGTILRVERSQRGPRRVLWQVPDTVVNGPWPLDVGKSFSWGPNGCEIRCLSSQNVFQCHLIGKMRERYLAFMRKYLRVITTWLKFMHDIELEINNLYMCLMHDIS